MEDQRRAGVQADMDLARVEQQELAFALSTALAYVRALHDGGIALEQARPCCSRAVVMLVVRVQDLCGDQAGRRRQPVA